MVDQIIAGTNVQPRPYQRRIVGKVLDMYGGNHINKDGHQENAAKSIIIVSPTGSGKTVMGLLAAKGWQAMNPDIHVAWIAMRRNLLKQAESENISKGINVQNIHFVSMFDSEPESLIQAKRDGKQILLVIDEAQHDAASSMTHLHTIIDPSWILGLTATPFRTDKVKLVFDKVIQDAGIHALIQDGFLSRYDHYTIPDWHPETVAKHYSIEPDRWGKSIFYFKNLTLCMQMQTELAKYGHFAEVVTGDSDWEDQLDRFRDGEVKLLINCMKLTEGFDEPSLHTAWVRDSGKGCTMQMGGRAFRLYNSLPVKNVVQSKNTRWPFIKTAMPELQYLWQEDSWVSLKVNPFTNVINDNARMAIAQSTTKMPAFITQRQRKVRPIRF
jgi:superfamily II DNA or RNA helicase